MWQKPKALIERPSPADLIQHLPILDLDDAMILFDLSSQKSVSLDGTLQVRRGLLPGVPTSVLLSKQGLSLRAKEIVLDAWVLGLNAQRAQLAADLQKGKGGSLELKVE